MQQNDDNDKDFTNKVSLSSEDKIEDMEDWRNEHGNPSNEFLQSLADDGGPAALEKLRAIAEDLDAEFSPGDSAEKLIGAIRSATGDDPNTTT
jgi:hypothetical protein